MLVFQRENWWARKSLPHTTRSLARARSRGVVSAGVEPHRVIDVQDYGMLRHGPERCDFVSNRRDIPDGFPMSWRRAGGARGCCRGHPQRAEGDLPRQDVAPRQGIFAHINVQRAERPIAPPCPVRAPSLRRCRLRLSWLRLRLCHTWCLATQCL